MRISTLALANLKRRKAKAAFLAAGIAIGIGTVIALLSLSGTIRREIGTQLDQFGANIVVVPRSDTLALDYGGVSVSSVSFDAQQLSDQDVRRIGQIPYSNRLSAVAPKLLGTVEVQGRQVLLAGVDFPSELRLKRWWQIAGEKPAGDDDLLVGYEAARALSLIEADPHAAHGAAGGHAGHGDAGDDGGGDSAMDGDATSGHATSGGAHHAAPAVPEVKLMKDRLTLGGAEFRVAGVIAPAAGPEDRMIFASLPRVQALLDRPGQLSLVEISALCKDCPVEDIVQQINAEVPHAKASAVQQTVRAREETVERLGRFSMSVSAVVLAIGALLIFTTMTGSVVERTREIGVLRAVGFRRAHIIRGLAIEVALISLAGGLLGWTAGTLVGWAALPYFAETELAFELRPLFLPAAVAGALLIGIVSSLHPILKASRLDPSEAVRSV